ncbi:hypothetical protein V6N13_039869 [Hibiscus sabdariffa]|uniref:Defensin-like protein n=1 Tax=Hibiscus sabdariffa TaxID=183260 RepID=A0ABR2SUZ9_9ROSI
MFKLPCNLFCLILLISSVGVRGQEMCRDTIPGDGSCDDEACNGQCIKSFPESNGGCLQTNTDRYTCQCSWPCS